MKKSQESIQSFGIIGLGRFGTALPSLWQKPRKKLW